MARAKEFDEQVVLTKAMKLFWEQGYEKTSMQELVDRMGIHRRSIYDTFGDKHQLFLKSLDLYEDNLANRITQRVPADKSVQGQIRRLLSITLERDEDQPAGCLIVNTASELALIDEEVSQKINEIFNRSENYIYNLLVEGEQKGEIPKSLPLKNAAHYLHTVWLGVRVDAKVTTDPAKIYQSIDLALSIIN